MAESKNNIITHGLSGKVGNLIVFRVRNGKTYVASKPKDRTGELSDAQKDHQKRFQQAVIYAKSALTNPETKQAYKDAASDGESAYNVAVADFMNAPDIEEIDLSKYTGKVGDTIAITVTDDFMVQEVAVTILNADGTEVEHGLAQPGIGGLQWIYTASATNDSLDGDKVIISASDLPGHITEKQETL
jgi:rRNA maturation endonuclease Nob1